MLKNFLNNHLLFQPGEALKWRIALSNFADALVTVYVHGVNAIVKVMI